MLWWFSSRSKRFLGERSKCAVHVLSVAFPKQVQSAQVTFLANVLSVRRALLEKRTRSKYVSVAIGQWRVGKYIAPQGIFGMRPWNHLGTGHAQGPKPPRGS